MFTVVINKRMRLSPSLKLRLLTVLFPAGMMGRGGDRGGFPPRGGPRGAMAWGGPPGPGNVPKRAGDWECPNP